MEGKTMKKSITLLITLLLLTTLSMSISADEPSVPTLEGPLTGYVDEAIVFTVSAIDPEGDDIQYFFDWGDGEDSYWIPEKGVESGEEFEVIYSWNISSEYDVRVKARDMGGNETEWSEPLTIHINCLKITSVSGGMGVSVTFENVGNYAKDIDWTVELIGGTIPGFHINKFFEGEIQALKAGESTTISTGTVFALGKFKIQITAECAGEPIVEETIDAKILFFYVML
jgi:hypothetical protein